MSDQRIRVLNIVASPRTAESVSRRLATEFVAALGAAGREVEVEIEVDTLDIWDAALPEFDPGGVGVKYKRISGAEMTEAERGISARVDALSERFATADRIVVGVPMWNWGIPYKLKQLIDLVTQRGALFDFANGAYTAGLTIPRAVVIGVRGQDRQAGFSNGLVNDADHHLGYVRFWLAAIGVARVDTVLVDHGWDDDLPGSEAEGRCRLAELAAGF